METSVPRPFSKTPLFWFVATEDGLGITLQREYLPTVQQFMMDASPYVVQGVTEWPGYSSFALDLEKSWGFDGLITPSPCADGDMIQWEALWSNGTLADQRVAARLSATLSLLAEAFRALAYKQYEGSQMEQEMLFLPLLTLSGGFQPGIGCTYSAKVRDRFRAWGDRELPEVRQLMRSVYLKMSGESAERINEWDVDAEVSGGYRLLLKVPGMASDICSDMHHMTREGPIELHGHNIDSPVQQLALFAGLIKVAQMVDRNQPPLAK